MQTASVRVLPEMQAVCEVRGLGPRTTEVCSLEVCHSALCTGIWHLCGFRGILSKIPADLGGWPGAPWRSGRAAALLVGPHLSPHLTETSETGLLFLGPYLLPCAPMFVGVLIKLFDSLKTLGGRYLEYMHT